MVGVVRHHGGRVSSEEVNGEDAFPQCLNEQVWGRCDTILFLHGVVKHVYSRHKAAPSSINWC